MKTKKIFFTTFFIGSLSTYSYMAEPQIRTFKDPSVFQELMRAIKNKDTKHVNDMFQRIRWTPDVNMKDEGDHTPLIDAVLTNQVDIVKLLVENGADLNARTKRSGMSALDIAKKGNLKDIEDYLTAAAGKKQTSSTQEIKQPSIEQTASKVVDSLAEKLKQEITSDKDVVAGTKKILTRLCKEVDEPSMRIFLEKLPTIVDRNCKYSKMSLTEISTAFKKNSPAGILHAADMDIVQLLEYAVDDQNNEAGLEKIVRTLSPIISVGFGQNINEIFEWRFDPKISGYPNTVFIDLKAHKEKPSVGSKYVHSWHKYEAVRKKENPDLAQELVQQYKIHLMPQEGSEERTFVELAKFIQENKGLQDRVQIFKIKTSPYKDLIKEKIPKIVIYVDGKDNAQYVLDTMYEHFKNYQGYTKYAPRYNQRVTDFLYFAQGDGDDKPHYPDLFEDGKDNPDYTGRIYFKSNVTSEGASGGYYLTLPTQKK